MLTRGEPQSQISFPSRKPFPHTGDGDGATHAEVEECLDHAHTSPITLLHALLGPVYATLHKEPVKPTLHMHVPVFVQI